MRMVSKEPGDLFLQEDCLDILQVMRVHGGRGFSHRVAANVVLLLGGLPARVRFAFMYLLYEDILAEEDDDTFYVDEYCLCRAGRHPIRSRLAKFWAS